MVRHLHFDLRCDKNWLFQANQTAKTFRQQCVAYTYVPMHAYCIVYIYMPNRHCPFSIYYSISLSICSIQSMWQWTCAFNHNGNQKWQTSRGRIDTLYHNQMKIMWMLFLQEDVILINIWKTSKRKSMVMILLTKCASINFVESFDFPVNNHFLSFHVWHDA